MRLDGRNFKTSRIGVRRSKEVHGTAACPKLEVEAVHQSGRPDLPVGLEAQQRVPTA